GEAWVPAVKGTPCLECMTGFVADSSVALFRARREHLTFVAGVGLAGRVWASKQSHWIRDVQCDENFLRAPWAREVGLKSALGIPILADKEVVAVLEFFMCERRDEDEQLVKVFDGVAAQLGLAIRQKRIEEKVRVNEEALRLLMESIQDCAIFT